MEENCFFRSSAVTNALYDFIKNAFVTAERESDVEIALIHIIVPSPFHSNSHIWNELDENKIILNFPEECKDVVTSEPIMQAVLMYKKEIAAGKKLIEEYLALKPYLLAYFDSEKTPDYQRGNATLTLTTGKGNELNFNKFVYNVRYKYWYQLLHNAKFVPNLTSNLRNEYFSKIKDFAKKDFSAENIRKVKLEMLQRTAQEIPDKIIDLFDQLSYENSMGCDGNIHYFSGWKSNDAFKINAKVVVPYMRCWDDIWKKYLYRYDFVEFLSDIEKTLDFLDGGETPFGRSISNRLQYYEHEQQTKNLEFKYFKVNVYKKGTIHIRFTN